MLLINLVADEKVEARVQRHSGTDKN